MRPLLVEQVLQSDTIEVFVEDAVQPAPDRQRGAVLAAGAVGRVLRRARYGRKVPLRQARDVADGVLPGRLCKEAPQSPRYFRRVAMPPRMWRSALFCSITALTCR